MKHTRQKLWYHEVTAVTEVETIVADTVTQIGHIDRERNPRSSKKCTFIIKRFCLVYLVGKKWQYLASDGRFLGESTKYKSNWWQYFNKGMFSLYLSL